MHRNLCYRHLFNMPKELRNVCMCVCRHVCTHLHLNIKENVFQQYLSYNWMIHFLQGSKPYNDIGMSQCICGPWMDPALLRADDVDNSDLCISQSLLNQIIHMRRKVIKKECVNKWKQNKVKMWDKYLHNSFLKNNFWSRRFVNSICTSGIIQI